MDLVYLPSGGTASTSYNIPMPAPVAGSFVLIQFLDPVGKLFIYVIKLTRINCSYCTKKCNLLQKKIAF
jgi:hypothetical protein